MDEQNRIVSLIKKEFSFLETKFGFVDRPTIISSREYKVEYQKSELLVRVVYSIVNNWIEIIIYNHISKVTPGKYDWRYSVSLAYIMKRKIADFDYKNDYEMLMPKNVSIEDAVSKLAQLFQKFASPILENKEWISWGEIAGYNQPVPKGLP